MSGRPHLVRIVFGGQLRPHRGQQRQAVTWSLLGLSQPGGFLSEMFELFGVELILFNGCLMRCCNTRLQTVHITAPRYVDIAREDNVRTTGVSLHSLQPSLQDNGSSDRGGGGGELRH